MKKKTTNKQMKCTHKYLKFFSLLNTPCGRLISLLPCKFLITSKELVIHKGVNGKENSTVKQQQKQIRTNSSTYLMSSKRASCMTASHF